MTDGYQEKTEDLHPDDANTSGAVSPSLPGELTLEKIIDLTDEMAHLNELVMLHIDLEGGFTSAAAYFSIVQPILDLLEKEIQAQYKPGIKKEEMKKIIGIWIDEEISRLQ